MVILLLMASCFVMPWACFMSFKVLVNGFDSNRRLCIKGYVLTSFVVVFKPP